MTRLPTLVAVQHLLDGLRALGEAPKRGQPARIDDLEARLIRAVGRDLAGVPIPDGYRTGIGGGRGGGPTIVVQEDGQPDVAVPATSVEAAVAGRGDAHRVRDRHHELTAKAVSSVEQAVTQIQVARAALDSIDDLVQAGPPAPKTCDHCTGRRGDGNDRPVYVRGTVGDRLERAIALCEPCYHFVARTAASGSRLGWLPDDEQIADHERRGRWRIHFRQGTARRAS